MPQNKQLTGYEYTRANEGGGEGIYKDTRGFDTGPGGVLVTPKIRQELAAWKGPQKDFWESKARRAYDLAQAGANKDFASVGVKQLDPDERTFAADMQYNMGRWLPKFPKFVQAYTSFRAQPSADKIEPALNELRNSAWFKQVKSRGPRNIELLRRSMLRRVPQASQTAFNEYMKEPSS